MTMKLKKGHLRNAGHHWTSHINYEFVQVVEGGFFFNNVGWSDTAHTLMISEIHPMELHYPTAHYRDTKATESPGFSHTL